MSTTTPQMDSTLELFHHPVSANSRRVTLTAHMLGLPLTDRLINLADAAARAGLADVNPNGKVPVLREGDFVLWESNAIMTYLCSKVPGQTLYPEAPRDRAEVDRWLFWLANHFAPPLTLINGEILWKRFRGGGEPDAQVIEKNLAQWRTAAAILDAHLATRPFLTGTLSLADLSLAATLMYARPTQIPVREFPNIEAALARVHALPAWQTTEKSFLAAMGGLA